MTHGELMREAEAAGMSFSLCGGEHELVSIGTPLLGWDKDVTRRVGELDREMRRRWGPFVAFVKLTLLARKPVAVPAP